MFSKKQILILGLIILAVGFFLRSVSMESKIEVLIQEEKYSPGEDLKIQITNNQEENICFSSCYPYYLERKIEKEEWERRSYGNCEEEDIAIKCISFKNLRAFELMLKNPERGVYRVSVPICINCREGEIFQEDKEIFSPFFEVK